MADPTSPIRYAILGLGHIAQVAVLPAFQNAGNARLTALISGDETKLSELGDRYQIDASHRFDYEDFDEFLEAGVADALYIALPNHLHHEYAIRAARAGMHILCEKPLAVTSDECKEMIKTCEEQGVLLMTAYRLHFEAANMKALQAAREGKFGDLRYLQASFSQDVTAGDVRLMPLEYGGGTVYDMGIYCINAARYLFGDEPLEVVAMSASKSGDERFEDCDEMTTALLRFPEDRLASFTSSFGSYATSFYRLVGTKGEALLDPAFGYATNLAYEFHHDDGHVHAETYEKRDQFGAQLLYFSDCILHDQRPEPDGYEGLVDVQIIEAIYESARTGEARSLDLSSPLDRPDEAQIITMPGFPKPEEVHASSPSEE